MATRKSPNLRKQDELDRDHRVYAEYPKAFRKNWPRKKARANRDARRDVQRLLAMTAPDELDDLASEVRAATMPKEKLHKSGVMPLRQWLQMKQRHRAAAVGRNARNAAAAARSQVKEQHATA